MRWMGMILLSWSVLFAQAGNEDLVGKWIGQIELPGRKLDIDVDLKAAADGTLTGDISIPAQGARDLPLINIKRDGADVQLEIEGVPGNPTFKGTLEGEAIKGNFEQGGGSFPFQLNKGEQPEKAAEAALAGFDKLVDTALEDFNVPGIAVAVVVNDKVVYARGHGYRDLENKEPVTPETLFAIGSSTKAFTTAVLASLVDEDKLEWDNPVLDYMPDFRLMDNHATHHLTVVDLVSHQSGLPRHDFSWYNSPLEREQLFKRLVHLEPSADLRERFQYQNLMYMTAGLLAARIEGGSWEDQVRKRILQPLGMKRANFSVADMQKDANHALPYQEKDQKLERMGFRNIDAIGPAGSINADIMEMSNWVRMQLNGGKWNNQQVLQSDSIKRMHTPASLIAAYPEDERTLNPAYGLGWMIDVYRGHYRVHHGGNIDGFSALVTMMPLQKMGLVLLTNKNGTGVPYLLSHLAYDLMLGLEPIDWLGEAREDRANALKSQDEAKQNKETNRVADTKPSHPLADYAAEYHNDGYGRVSVVLEDGKLKATYNQISVWLEHWHYNVFNAKAAGDDPAFDDTKVLFRYDEQGLIEQLAINMELEAEAIVFKRLPDQKLKDPEYLKRFTGRYQLGPQEIEIQLRGNTLFALLVGQPDWELKPDQGTRFEFKELNGFSIEFSMEGDKVEEMVVNQPNGTFKAKPITE